MINLRIANLLALPASRCSDDPIDGRGRVVGRAPVRGRSSGRLVKD
jgi:hypothetical protein